MGMVCHPRGTERDRGPLQPCHFTIKDNYYSDPCGRWRDLGDIEVKVLGANFPESLHIYLIPSGKATPLLGHSDILHRYPGLLNHKRMVSREFIEERMGRQLEGFWFYLLKNGIEYPTVYSNEYDECLNSRLPSSPSSYSTPR